MYQYGCIKFFVTFQKQARKISQTFMQIDKIFTKELF